MNQTELQPWLLMRPTWRLEPSSSGSRVTGSCRSSICNKTAARMTVSSWRYTVFIQKFKTNDKIVITAIFQFLHKLSIFSVENMFLTTDFDSKELASEQSRAKKLQQLAVSGASLELRVKTIGGLSIWCDTSFSTPRLVGRLWEQTEGYLQRFSSSIVPCYCLIIFDRLSAAESVFNLQWRQRKLDPAATYCVIIWFPF